MKLLRMLIGPALICAAFFFLWWSWNAYRNSIYAELDLIAIELQRLSMDPEGEPPIISREVAERDLAFFTILTYSTLAAGIGVGIGGVFVCYRALSPAKASAS
jgi:hypothetical protein